jgi:hypothetical protein
LIAKEGVVVGLLHGEQDALVTFHGVGEVEWELATAEGFPSFQSVVIGCVKLETYYGVSSGLFLFSAAK